MFYSNNKHTLAIANCGKYAVSKPYFVINEFVRVKICEEEDGVWRQQTACKHISAL